MSERGGRVGDRLVFGLAVIAIGVIYMLDNFGLANAHDVLRWWPAALLAYGLFKMIGIGCRRAVGFGATLTGIGGWMLLYRAGLVTRDVFDLWPVLLIVWGVAMIRGRGRIRPYVWGIGVHRRRRWRDGEGNMQAGGDPGIVGGWITRSDAPGGADTGHGAEPSGSTGGAGSDPGAAPAEDRPTFHVEVLMSTLARRVTSRAFTGGTVLAALGGADVDLRSARMESGTARLDVQLVMGGLNLFVPETWDVEFEGSPVMGTVDDRTRRNPGAPGGRLVITGVVLMSTLNIKN